MPIWPALWLALVVVLVSLFVVMLRRMSRLVARTRDLERFQRAVADIDARFGNVADPLVASLDDLRRRSGDPASVAASLPGAEAFLTDVAPLAASLRAPAGYADRVVEIVAELERAVRALELIDHGLAGLASVRGPRELEVQTTLKRGTLNLRNARAAVRETAAGIAALRPVDLAEPGVRARARRPVPVYTPTTSGDQRIEGRSDHTM